MYVCDTKNHRIQKFDSTGEFIQKWGSEDSSDGQLDGPLGIAVDNLGNVYVVDSGRYDLIKVFALGIDTKQNNSTNNGEKSILLLHIHVVMVITSKILKVLKNHYFTKCYYTEESRW